MGNEVVRGDVKFICDSETGEPLAALGEDGQKRFPLGGSTTPAAVVKWGVIGDSRMVDQGQLTYPINGVPRARSFSSKNWVNWVSKMRGGFRVVANGAHGGWRSDQYLVNLPVVLAAAPDVLVFGPPCLNDLSQSYPTAATSVAVALANVEAAIAQAERSVPAIVVCTEPGSTDLSTAYVARTTQFNTGLYEIAARHPRVRIFDLRSIVHATTSGPSGILFKSGYLYDNAHYAAPGARAIAQSFVGQHPDLCGPAGRTHRLADSPLERQTIDPSIPVDNPLFLATTGGTSSGPGAVTGPIPKSWEIVTTAGATVVCSQTARADGCGNDLVLTITAAAACVVRAHCALVQNGFARWAKPGASYRGACDLNVDSSAAMLPPALRMYVWSSAGSYSAWDMASGTLGMPAGAYGYPLVCEGFIPQNVDANDQADIDFDVQMQFSGPGSAVVRFGRVIVHKIDSVPGYVVGA